jgi:D-alanyl-D-alanine carboxypeptidase/D-alanyl-D-alanine-endopeptidase (penicillin-binding protein 4)
MPMLFTKLPIGILFHLIFSQIIFSQNGLGDLQDNINSLLEDPFFTSSNIAIDIYDLTAEESLFRHNEKLLLHPASTMKLLTSAAGLIFLDRNYNFKTELYHSGIIENNILYGDLFIVGGLDPLFTTEDLNIFVTAIKSLGLKKITGNILADISKKDSLYWGSGWNWDDDPDPDAPYLSALNIDNNVIEVFVQSGEIDSLAVISLKPETDFVKVINNAITVSADFENDFNVTRDWINRNNTIIIDGFINTNRIQDSVEHVEKVNLLEPEKYFLTLFEEKLRLEGILVENGIGEKKLTDNNVFLSSVSRPIDSVIVYSNKESDNLSAEMILYAIAFNDSGSPAQIKNGLEAINKLARLIGFDNENYSFADGSGVSRYNLISAELLTELLKYIYFERSDLFPLFYYSLPVGGIDGTLEKRMKEIPLLGNVHAKTGTLKGVSTIAGYLRAKNSHLISFSILIQNYTGKNSVPRNLQDTICEFLAEYE